MPYLRFLQLMLAATFFGLASLLYVIFRIDPFTSGWIGPVSFYTSLMLVCVGGFFLLGALFHRLTAKDVPVLPRHVRGWLRRSLLLSIACVVFLLLASLDLLSLPLFLGLTVILLAVEGLFLYIHQGRRV